MSTVSADPTFLVNILTSIILGISIASPAIITRYVIKKEALSSWLILLLMFVGFIGVYGGFYGAGLRLKMNLALWGTLLILYWVLKHRDIEGQVEGSASEER